MFNLNRSEQKDEMPSKSDKPEEDAAATASGLDASVEALRRFLSEKFNISEKTEATEKVKVSNRERVMKALHVPLGFR